MWRLDHRIRKAPRGIPARRTVGEYLRANVYLTTSGNFRTSTLMAAISEIGADRILFSVDYPFERTIDAVSWFDAVVLESALPAAQLEQIAAENARTLFTSLNKR